jgi:heat shock protein HslJ
MRHLIRFAWTAVERRLEGRVRLESHDPVLDNGASSQARSANGTLHLSHVRSLEPAVRKPFGSEVTMALWHIGFAVWLATLSTVASAQTTGGSNQASGLEGGWNAIELYGAAVAPDAAAPERRPHLVFGADGRLSGADGCNRLTGPYTVKANGITFGPMAGTQMACPKTDEIAQRFRAALTGTSHWRLAAERLEFYGATGKPLAVFERRPATAAGGAMLEGTTWQLVRFQGGDDRTLTPDDPAKYTIEFAAGGRVAARIDCNRGSGTWKSTSAGQLEFGPLALTRAMCPEGSLQPQIAKQWTNVRSYLIRDGRLFLSLMADGGTYEFAPVPAKKP